MSEQAKNTTWFLKDEPLSDLGEEDSFGHRAYVNLLTQAISEIRPPFTFGLFGSWGVGKSSIVNALKDKLTRSGTNTRAVTIDVWKYQDDSLRRQFLFDLQQELHSQKALPKGRDYIREVYEERTEELPSKPRFDFTRARVLAIPLVSSYAVAAGFIWLFLALGVANPIQALVAGFVAPAALFLIAEFSRSVVVVSKDTITRPVYFSEDQFERKFEEIVKDAKCEKLVIIVDNLDRCSHELVVDTLSAIKTFLEPKGEKCIFVIPCDDGAIRQHVKASYGMFGDNVKNDGGPDPEQYAVEYLRKFFSGSTKIYPFLPEEIEPYIEHLLSQMKLTEEMEPQEVSTLVQMVGFLFREDPRQIKQFLNNLTSRYLLTKEREDGPSRQINPPISGDRLFIAKVAAIETRFPTLYRQFLENDNLFTEVHAASTTPSQAGEIKSLLTVGDDVSLLESFLRTTGHVTADNPKAFFHLKQSSHEAMIPNYAQFDAALRRGDVETARKAYEDGGEEDNAARTEVLIRSIDDWANKGYVDTYALNAVRVAASLKQLPSVNEQRLSQEVIRALATAPGLLGRIQQVRDPNAVFEMMGHAYPNHRRTVQDAYVAIYTHGPGSHPSEENDDTKMQGLVAKSLVIHLANLSDDQKSRIRSATASWDNPRPTLLDTLSSNDEAKEAFVDPSVLSKIVDNIKAEDLDSFSRTTYKGNEHHSAVLVLIRCQDLGDQYLANQTAAKIADLLEHATTQNSDQLFWYVTQVAADLASLLEQVNSEALDKIVGHFHEKYRSVEPEQKTMLTKLLCRLYGKASEAQRNNIDSVLISDFLWALPIEHVLELLKLRGDSGYESAPWNQIDGRLAERLVAGPDVDQSRDNMVAISRKISERESKHLVPLLVQLMQRQQVAQAISLVELTVQDLPQGNRGKSLLAPVLDATLNVSGPHGQPENHTLLLELAIKLKELHTRDFQERLDNHLVDLIIGSDPLTEVGVQMLDTIRSQGAVSDDRYTNILKEVSAWLIRQPTDSPLQATSLHMLDKVMQSREKVLTDKGRRDQVIAWVARRQDSSIPAAEREQTVKHLATVDELPTDVLRDLIPRLVYQAENDGDENMRSTLDDTLVVMFEKNHPEDRELWNDLDDYRRRLLNSSEDAKKELGSRLNREMRRIRRAARGRSGETINESGEESSDSVDGA